MNEGIEENKNEHKKEGFSVPPGFFKDEALKITKRIAWEDEMLKYPQLSSLKASTPFTVPDHYFEEAAVSVSTDLYLQTLKQDVLAVPGNYFEKSALSLAESIDKQSRVKVIPVSSVPKKSPTQYWFYRAAAAVLVVAGAWIAVILNSRNEKDCGGIACLERQEIIKSKSIENIEQEELYDLVDPEALRKNLDIKKTNHQEIQHNDSDVVIPEELFDEI